MKIVLTRSMLSSDIEYIKDGLDKEIRGGYELVVPTEFSEEGICLVCSDADVLLGPYVSKKILETAADLKLIQVPWTGMETFDFKAVENSSVPVCNTHSNADSVAEMGVAIVLDLLKKIAYHDRKMRVGNWNRDQKPLGLQSKMVSRQTVCLLGFGNIGSKIGRIMSAFGAEVIAVDDNSDDKGIAVEVYTGARIKEAVPKADVIICTLPLTDATHGMINDELIIVMKDGVVLVNMSRAEVMDEDAVWNAIENGKISAFGADVWWNAPKRGETESYPSSTHEFWKRDNVILSPHRAGYIENTFPHLDGAVDNIIALAKGKPFTGVVDKKKGY